MESYKRWVRINKDYVSSLDTLINGMTWLLPERFSESEIGPEAVSSILGIVTTLNGHIIDTTPTQTHTKSTPTTSFPYSLCLTLLKDLETLVEVVGQQLCGEDKKWTFIAFTEASKVLVRLALLRSSGYRVLLKGGDTINIGKDSASVDENLENRGRLTGQYPQKLEGRAMSALSRFGDNARTGSEPSWLRRVQHQQSIMEPSPIVVKRPTLSSILSEKGLLGGLFVTGEVMFILRPLVYVLLIRKYGVRSWFPWLTSVAVDLTGMSILSYLSLSPRGEKDKGFHLSNAEKHELNRRKLLWAFYLMQDPFFTKYTRRKLESTEKLLEPVPIVGFLAAKLIELVIGAQTRYTYMSGS